MVGIGKKSISLAKSKLKALLTCSIVKCYSFHISFSMKSFKPGVGISFTVIVTFCNN